MMAFINEAESAMTDAHTRSVYARQEQAFGYLPNYARLFSHRPQIIDLWSELQKGLQAHMSKRLFELTTLAAAQALKSSYCTLAHGSRLRTMFTDDELHHLATGEFEAVVTSSEAAAMRYAAAVARDANSVDKHLIDALRAEQFTETQIFDIAGVAAGRAFFSKLVEGLGARPDAAYRMLPQQLQQCLTVGRAVAEPDEQSHA